MIHLCTSRNIDYVAIDCQVCFHRWLFANPVKLYWTITGPVGPLGSTNQNWLGARLLPMAISIYPVVCVHSCHQLEALHHCLWPNVREGPPLACQHTSMPLSPSPTHILPQPLLPPTTLFLTTPPSTHPLPHPPLDLL